MMFSLKLGEEAYIELGETREELIYRLDKSKIKYTIPYDKTSSNENVKVKETILHIVDLAIEVSIRNDIVQYIKSKSNQYTNVYAITPGKTCSASDLIQVKRKVAELFSIDENKILIENTNLRTLETVMIVDDSINKVRIHLMPDMRGNVFVGTLKYV